ncbi:hypothetical protein PHYBLDRAFT_164499 [Phycomyces blakesleeanus NRRL 1555(-)]|uniref:FAR1 domain-containing protein n=1 Tax=Phycomyces blakesleeanus (strain ATCC 8743b / DSM 1359 / FGSC 10004 / NBRC 33097 / NRRL 1555) TaxID=763407 RepID=A0A162Y0M3_PHYB8|nr:hypothetical protein PHYBLDRAFT_164499 [Phycomyces blakesleeanus NRRL 1555(-)]OAD77595.1 hypothetical protein PHYBLDRAFT_164499 [Phycomyces blakesleeanus NRRL 1555(-)]|eukprot:XP_018295635.1 hypothetical protein PHYBLDRAFT_164499 [Phycomyces blakesleeanus NRRL 1555(-)]
MSNATMSTVIYNIYNVQNALVNSSLDGIKMLPLNTTISVNSSEWQQCLDRINFLCSTKWTKKRRLRERELIFGETRQCHRAGIYKSERQNRLAQKDSKTCGCTAALQIKQYISNPDVVTFCMKKDHTNHVPGEASEIGTLPLPSEEIKIIEDQLRGGNSCNNTGASVLRQIDDWSVGAIFLLTVPTKNLFAFGFQSPSQVGVMIITQSFCLDATHNISSKNMEVTYSFVNAIAAALHLTAIHYCELHALRAWQHNLDNKSERRGKEKEKRNNRFKASNLANNYIEAWPKQLNYYPTSIVLESEDWIVLFSSLKNDNENSFLRARQEGDKDNSLPATLKWDTEK